jgi:hypothetical protein
MVIPILAIFLPLLSWGPIDHPSAGDPQGGTPGNKPMHEPAATVCLAPPVGALGGCPGRRRWESADSESSLPLGNQGMIRVRLLI